MQRHLAPELRSTVGASVWVSLSAPLLTEKGKPRVTVGRKVTDRWPGCAAMAGLPEALPMRTRRDRDRTDRRSGVT